MPPPCPSWHGAGLKESFLLRAARSTDLYIRSACMRRRIPGNARVRLSRQTYCQSFITVSLYFIGLRRSFSCFWFRRFRNTPPLHFEKRVNHAATFCERLAQLSSPAIAGVDDL